MMIKIPQLILGITIMELASRKNNKLIKNTYLNISYITTIIVVQNYTFRVKNRRNMVTMEEHSRRKIQAN